MYIICDEYLEQTLCYDKHNKSKRFNTLRPRQNGRHSADDILKCIFLNENVWILIKISLKFVPRDPSNNIPASFQIIIIIIWTYGG